MVNEVSSPEVEELVEGFKTMTTIVKSANLSLGRGDINVAKQIYEEALVLFKKLDNERGVRVTPVSWALKCATNIPRFLHGLSPDSRHVSIR